MGIEFSKAYPVLPADEQRRLIALAQAGDTAAKDKVILHSLGLVAKVVAPLCEDQEDPFQDLFHEGVFGLMRAIELYDVARPVKFSTYAMLWIQQAVWRVMGRSSGRLYIPHHIHEVLIKVRKYQRLGAQTPEDIARQARLPLAQVRDLLHYDGIKYASLDYQMPTDGGDGDTFAALIADEECDVYAEIERQEEQDEARQQVERVLAVLSPKQREIVSLLYGIGSPALTAAEIAERLCISRQRVYQLADDAMAKMRSAELEVAS